MCQSCSNQLVSEERVGHLRRKCKISTKEALIPSLRCVIFRKISVGPLFSIQVLWGQSCHSAAMRKKSKLDSMSGGQSSRCLAFTLKSAPAVPRNAAIKVPERLGYMTCFMRTSSKLSTLAFYLPVLFLTSSFQKNGWAIFVESARFQRMKS